MEGLMEGRMEGPTGRFPGLGIMHVCDPEVIISTLTHSIPSWVLLPLLELGVVVPLLDIPPVPPGVGDNACM